MQFYLVKVESYGQDLKNGGPANPFTVRAWMQSKGAPKRYDVTIKPRTFGRGKDALALVNAEDQFYKEFGLDHRSANEILNVVGRIVRGEEIMLPYVAGEAESVGARRVANPK